MEAIVAVLAALSYAPGAIKTTFSVREWVVKYLRGQNRDRKASDVLQWLHNLGTVAPSDIEKLLSEWSPPEPVSQEVRQELTVLLSNLVRTSRFHTTQGTTLSSFLRCERLIEQLLTNIIPKRRAGEPVADGRKDWTLEKYVGMGAFGEVWVGRNEYYPDKHAFKFFTEPAGKEWLKREGEALCHIKTRLVNCPNVIGYLDIEINATPHPYLMLEYVEGGSLEDWILTPASERRSIDLLDVMTGIARGLGEAHQHKIYHRDLKPANLLISNDVDPVPKIADFGLSRIDTLTTSSDSGASGTSQSVVVGTRMYLPPEAADPYELREAAQDDVFAFGVVWYQMITKLIERPPYDFSERLQLAGVDARSIRIISRCLAHPSRRFSDAGEILEALDYEPWPIDVEVPSGCFDVSRFVVEYFDSQDKCLAVDGEVDAHLIRK